MEYSAEEVQKMLDKERELFEEDLAQVKDVEDLKRMLIDMNYIIGDLAACISSIQESLRVQTEINASVKEIIEKPITYK